ncbi:hypothetical protein SJ05684_b46560 (plasmid) [Sinorhizobium sojae CCBAU 05684]|uniref:Uncharacterized protein n=1 Tax=Sinorhizobium sojae CCBAU 05684 TaxID=716928 RepID=A0A249PI96_9HYPH|nr:hypothetical protein SJ05684_b46560 [Sinorhizobium sojae CCBAU 05684]
MQTLGCSERHERNLRKGMYSLTKNEEAGGIKAVTGANRCSASGEPGMCFKR